MHGHFMLLQSITSSIASVIIAKQCFNFFHQIVGMERIELEVFQHICPQSFVYLLKTCFLLLSTCSKLFFFFPGETKRKFESVYTGGTMSTPDSGQVFQYWHCCGSEDPFDPGCTAAPHSSYDD